MADLKITKEKVVEAAKTCPDAAKVLKTLFPEAFGSPKLALKVTKTKSGGDDFGTFTVDGIDAIQIRTMGPNAGKCFFLNDAFDWEIRQEDVHSTKELFAIRKN